MSVDKKRNRSARVAKGRRQTVGDTMKRVEGPAPALDPNSVSASPAFAALAKQARPMFLDPNRFEFEFKNGGMLFRLKSRRNEMMHIPSRVLDRISLLEQIAQRRGVNSVQILDAVLASLSSPSFKQSTVADPGTIQNLISHSGLRDTSSLENWNPKAEEILRTKAVAATAAELRASLLTENGVAKLLRTEPKVVADMARRGKLVSLEQGKSTRYPRWQFKNRALLPHIGELTKAIQKADLHPLDLDSFMEAPAQKLDGLNPVDHLLAGGDPKSIAELLDSAGRL